MDKEITLVPVKNLFAPKVCHQVHFIHGVVCVIPAKIYSHIFMLTGLAQVLLNEPGKIAFAFSFSVLFVD